MEMSLSSENPELGYDRQSPLTTILLRMACLHAS